MKNINGFWVDENNNRWSEALYTEEEAKTLSNTLFGCEGCVNCIECIGCNRCTRCTYCTDCIGCTRCTDCIGCTRCTECTRCTDCIGCTYCSTLKRNPQRYLSGNIGSRHSKTRFYWLKDKIQVVCGCWSGTLEEFEQRVNDVYPKGKYGDQYRAEIEKVKCLINA